MNAKVERDDSRSLAERTVVLLHVVRDEIERLVAASSQEETALDNALQAVEDTAYALSEYIAERIAR